MRHARYVPLAIALGLVACGRSYVYRPAVSTTAATIAGLPASYYPIPPEAPSGHVRIATMGFAGISPRGAPGEEIRALHLRMIVANNSERAWIVDTREQRTVLPSDGESRPAYATASQGEPPRVEIPARDERTIDLFYPLPAHMQKESKVPSFDMLWQVDTDTRRIVERTPFERVQVEPARDPYPDYYVWGDPYWYDPYYVRGGAFIGVRFAPAYVVRPVVIHHRVYGVPPGRRVR
jgi:hypothetical protein